MALCGRSTASRSSVPTVLVAVRVLPQRQEHLIQLLLAIAWFFTTRMRKRNTRLGASEETFPGLGVAGGDGLQRTRSSLAHAWHHAAREPWTRRRSKGSVEASGMCRRMIARSAGKEQAGTGLFPLAQRRFPSPRRSGFHSLFNSLQRPLRSSRRAERSAPDRSLAAVADLVKIVCS